VDAFSNERSPKVTQFINATTINKSTIYHQIKVKNDLHTHSAIVVYTLTIYKVY